MPQHKSFLTSKILAGILRFKNLHQHMYLHPLSDVPVNRVRGHSVGSNLSSEDQIVYSGQQAVQPLRQPQSAPTGDLAQRHQGFARFLKEHSSPTHQRVTAGGRIVPMQHRQPPPVFGLAINNETHGGVNPAKGPFATIKPTHERGRNPGNGEPTGIPFITASEHVYTRSSSLPESSARISGLTINEKSSLNTGTNVDRNDALLNENSTFDVSAAALQQTQMKLQLQQMQMQSILPQYQAVSGVYGPVTTQGQGIQDHYSWMTLPQTMAYPVSLNTSSTFDNASAFLGGMQPQDITTLQHGQEDTQRSVQRHDQPSISSTEPAATADQNAAYGLPAPGSNGQFALGPYAQMPNIPGHLAYQSPFLVSSSSYFPGLLTQPQNPFPVPGSGFGTNLSMYNPLGAHVQQASNSATPQTAFDRYENKFNVLTRHLKELDQFLAIHEAKLSRKVYGEKIRERENLVLKRAEARQRMHDLEKKSHSRDVPALVAVQPQLWREPSSGSQNQLTGTPLNVQAPPWTPKGISRDLNSTDFGTTSQDLAVRHSDYSSMVKGNPQTHQAGSQRSPSQQTNDSHSQVSFQISPPVGHASARYYSDHDGPVEQTVASTAPKACVETPGMPISRWPNQRIGCPVRESSPSAKNANHKGSNDNSRALILPSDSEALSQPPKVYQTNINYEKLMDALRLPKGCVTTVNFIGDDSTMVHGQGLKQPPWEEMADHEREYWKRKPDGAFFLGSFGIDVPTLEQTYRADHSQSIAQGSRLLLTDNNGKYSEHSHAHAGNVSKEEAQ